MSIKTKLFLVAMQCIAIIFAIIAVSSFMQSKAKDESVKASHVFLPAAMASKDVKFGICDIQQFLTDASATKNLQSIKDSQESAKLLRENLQILRKIYNETEQKERIAQIDQIDKNLVEYQKIGEDMALTYINKGTAEGNVKMDKFDKISEELAKEIDALAKTESNKIVASADTISGKISSALNISIIFGVIGALAMFASLYVVTRSILTSVSSISEISEIATDVKNGNGDLTKRITINGSDEISNASKSTNDFIESVRQLISDVKKSSNDNASTSSQLSSVSRAMQKNAVAQSALAKEAVQGTNKISSFISNTISDAVNAQNNVKMANEILEKTKTRLNKMGSAVRNSVEIENEFASRLHTLSENAEQVKHVLSVIGDIADQTNLLALNAAIEAARAGEHGRGFAVVADEVRKLAERTQKSLVETNATINTIVQAITDASEQMGKNADEIKHLGELSSELEDETNTAARMVSESHDVVSAMAQNAEANSKEVSNIVNQISSISDIISNTSRSLEETSEAVQQLDDMTERLSEKLSKFRT